MDKIILGKVKKGQFKPYDPTAFRLTFAKLEGKDVEVVVRRKKKHRSGAQNAFYWGIVIDIISGATGFTPQESHDAMRFKFLVNMEGDLPKVKSTTELTTVEFLDYVAQIQQWAGEFLDCYIPDPNEGEI
jgi:hypothetical protein